MKAQTGRTGADVLFFNLGARWGSMFKATPGSSTPRETVSVPIA
jgi:hypothetical protein